MGQFHRAESARAELIMFPLYGAHVDLCDDWQISEEEFTFLTGSNDRNDDNAVLEKLFHPNLKLLLVTEGSEGCRYFTKASLQKCLSVHVLVCPSSVS